MYYIAQKPADVLYQVLKVTCENIANSYANVPKR